MTNAIKVEKIMDMEATLPALYADESLEVCVSKGQYGDPPQVAVHARATPDFVGQLVIQLLMAPGALCSGVADSNDPSGRAIFRLLTPDEMADRAFGIAEAFYQRAKMVPLPSMAEASAIADFRRKSN